MSKIITIKGRGVILKDDNVDTDRIIPARFLRCVTFDSLGQHVFEDDRAAVKEQGQTHPFDDPRYQSASILIAGTNFGSGSSREHAVHALARWNQDQAKAGIKAIIAKGKYSEIFFGNALANGLPCFIIQEKDWQSLVEMIEHDSNQEIEIDIEKMAVKVGSNFFDLKFQHQAARDSLLEGSWDNLSMLLEVRDQIEEKIQGLPYV